MRISTKALSAGGLLTVLAASGISYHFWLSRPVPQTSYYGLLLDKDGKPEVNYKLGDPDFVEDDTDLGSARGILIVKANVGDPNALPTGRDFKSFDKWGYKTPDLWVEFRKSAGTIAEVRCSSACKPLLGINIGDTEESVTNRLGAPTDAVLQGTTKAVLYQSLHLVVWLARERVNAMAMGLYENVRAERSR
jgi:hypothetical protein